MATVTSITAEKAKEIENASIVDGQISGSNLILKTKGGSQINVGVVKADVLDAWPIGSIFLGAVSTSPATLLGGGTWVRIAENRFLVGQGSDPEFDTALETGGSKTIENNNLPAHTHTAPSHTHSGTTSADGLHNHGYDGQATRSDQRFDGANSSYSNHNPLARTSNDGTHSHSFTTGAGGGSETGVGPAVKAPFYPQYTVVYVWRRTA